MGIDMSRIGKMTWITALLLLLLAGTDVLIFDLVSSVVCDEVSSGSTSPDDECFCCCAHVEFVAPTVVLPLHVLDIHEPALQLHASSREPSSIYHPPRA